MYKVLIVDDSKLARMAMTKILKALRPEWSRLEAAGAEEAVTMVSSERPDIAFLDFNMPGRDGLTLVPELQAINPNMSIAVVSANIQTEVVNRAAAAGASFLAKPLNEQALADFLVTAQQRLQDTTK